MDRFVNDRNVERYRKLACVTTTTAEREYCSLRWPRKTSSSLGQGMRVEMIVEGLHSGWVT